MSEAILDASALIAFLRDEPAHSASNAPCPLPLSAP